MKTPGFWFRPPGLLAKLLTPLGAVYYGISRRRRAVPATTTTPLVVVGNVVAGGAGKTPVVIALTRLLQQRGVKVHLIAKGYGGRLKGPLQVQQQHTVQDVGDEPLLLLQHAPTFIGHDRGATYELAAQGADIVISDDGLQSPRLKASLALLVLDGVLGFGNGKLIPAGPLRETVTAALERVHAVIQIGGGERPLGKKPLIVADFVPADTEWLRGAHVIAFAGIGQPEKFFATLTTCGAKIIAAHAFADHHSYTQKQIAALIREAEEKNAILVTTTKDAVRITPQQREHIRVLDGALAWRNPNLVTALLEEILKNE